MRLINYEDFIRMPAGTIFAPYKPCVTVERLAIKTDEGKVLPYSWAKGEHLFNGVMPLEPWLGDTGLYNIGDREDASFEIYDGANSDYMDYKMFLVFEEADIDLMIKVLIWAKNGCVGEVEESNET